MGDFAQHHGWTIALALLASGCDPSARDLLSRVPLIAPEVEVPAAPGPITLRATITQDGQPIDPSLVVTCQVTRRLTPDERSEPFGLTAVRGAGSSWTCPVLPQLQTLIRPNQVLGVTWSVFARRQGQSPLKVAESEAFDTMPGCSVTQQAQTLRNEQARVMARFGGLTTAAQIAAAGFVPSHGFVSFAGMGVAFVRASDGPSAVNLANAGQPGLNNPNLLLFLPRGPAIRDVTGPDEPYTLIGWAYARAIGGGSALPRPPEGAHDDDNRPVDPRPVLPCIPHHEWMIHAQGIHTTDGGFHVSHPGEANPAGLPHAAIWDLHIFARPAGSPEIAILNRIPGLFPLGLRADPDAFYYPTRYD